MFVLKFVALALWMMITALSAIVIGLVRLPFRGRDLWAGVVFGRTFAWGSRFITGIRLQIDGKENLSPLGTPVIYVANHQSMYDVAVFGAFYPPGCVIIGKREVKWIPVFGWLFWLVGNILIDRKNRSSAFNSLDQVVERVKQDRVSVWIFPEGTRNATGEGLLPFKRGPFYLAQKTQVPLVPVVVSRMHDSVNPNHKRLGPGQIRVRIGAAIPPPAWDEDLNVYAQTTRETMLRVLSTLCLLIVVGMTAGCAGAPKIKGQPPTAREGLALDNKPYSISQILGGVDWIRGRRPVGESVDPKASPGGTDYRSDPAPDAHLDCEPLDQLLQPSFNDGLMGCLQSLNTQASAPGAAPLEFWYRLERETQPLLQLQDLDEAPDCLKTHLPQIAVPREIFFLIRDREDRLACMSSRVPMDAGNFLGIRLPAKGVQVRLHFPDPALPQDVASVRRWLQAWALTPYFYFENDRKIQGKYVPESLCTKCFGGRLLLERRTDLVPHWP